MQGDPLIDQGKWNLKKLLLWHGLALLLLASFFLQSGKHFWDLIDIYVFTTLNSSLEASPFSQFFWACFNHTNADWLEDGVILLFFYALIKKAPSWLKSRKVAELLFCILYTSCILFLSTISFSAKYYIFIGKAPRSS